MNKYRVQVGRGKGAYKTRWSFDTENQALMWYHSINIWNKYKKRILDPNDKVIARYISVD